MLEYCVWKNSYISFIWVCFKWKLSILGMYGLGWGDWIRGVLGVVTDCISRVWPVWNMIGLR